jgi:hypothetical protein
VELTIPVFAVPRDTRKERAPLLEVARAPDTCCGSTRDHACQFDDLGLPRTSPRLNECRKSEPSAGFVAAIIDDVLEHVAVAVRWDDRVEALVRRDQGTARQLVLCLAAGGMAACPATVGRWERKMARAVRAAGDALGSRKGSVAG